MRLSLGEIAACLGAETGCPQIQASGAAIDSRKVKPGDLFFCLPGVRVDGHDYACMAAEKGAACVIATRPLANLPIPVIQVEDAGIALGKVAKFWRKHMAGRVICLTGTAGKTTLKDTLAPILARDGKCTATAGNFNNQIGLPLTILNTDGEEKYCLLEAGISHAGDMEYLGEICEPDLALILNVGEGHTDGLGDNGVAWHKTRLLNFLAPAGRALINADYPELAAEAKKTGAILRWFGNISSEVDYGPCIESGPGFTIRQAGAQERFTLASDAQVLPETLLAAVSVALELGISCEKIQAGLAQMHSPEHRFQLTQISGHIIIDDSYNANPLSMRISLARASQKAKAENLPLIAVLGEMGELGAGAQNAHVELGKLLEEIRPAAVFWKGQWSEQIAAGYSGLLYQLGSPDSFPQLLTEAKLPEQAIVIFKGSRVNRLEQYLEAMLADCANGRRTDAL